MNLCGSPKSGVYNCPNCGAPMTDNKCSYCGTILYDFACLDMDKPAYIKIKHDGKITICKVQFTSCEIRYDNPIVSLYADNVRQMSIRGTPSAEIELNFIALSDNNNNLFTVVTD